MPTCGLPASRARHATWQLPNFALRRVPQPANVFIDKHHNFKLGDFGLAKVLGDNAEFARTNVGTPYYMAPEQVNEVPYNEKCDIWSLGCMVYELAAKAPPFEAHNQLALAVKIKAGKIQRLPEPYSDELNHAVRSMLCLDPIKRPSVEDLLRMPRMQELAEVSMKTAMSVPQPYLDLYFSSQMKRLEQKEAELTQRSTELAAKEKEKRSSGGSGSSGSGVSDAEVAKRENEVRAREREVERKEAELKRREREMDDAKAAVSIAPAQQKHVIVDSHSTCACPHLIFFSSCRVDSPNQGREQQLPCHPHPYLSSCLSSSFTIHHSSCSSLLSPSPCLLIAPFLTRKLT